MQFLLYALVFLFGFFTYRTFFIYRVARSSLFMLRSAQRTSLVMLIRAIENYSYAKTFCVERMVKSDASEKDIDNFKIYLENDMKHLKQNAIKDINKALPEHFKTAILFKDWDSAIALLDTTTPNSYFKD